MALRQGKDPTLSTKHLPVQSKYPHNRVEDAGDDHEEGRDQKGMFDLLLESAEGEGSAKGCGPESKDMVVKEEELEGLPGVGELSCHSRRDLESSDDQEPTDTTNASDQDVTGEEGDQRAQLQ